MRSSFSGYQREGLLIDSNILLLLMVGAYDAALARDFKRTAHFSSNDLDLLESFVNRFARIITTPYLLAEVNGLANGLPERHKEGFFESFRRIISRIVELRSPATEVCAMESFKKYGFCDAAVENALQQRFLLLTDDFRLTGFLESKNIDVVNFRHLRTMSFV